MQYFLTTSRQGSDRHPPHFQASVTLSRITWYLAQHLHVLGLSEALQGLGQ